MRLAPLTLLAALLLTLPLLTGGGTRWCEPEDRAWHEWAAPGAGQLVGPRVPADEVWEVRAAGVAVKAPQGSGYGGGEFMLQLERPTPLGRCCWKVPLARTDGAAFGTPVLALPRPVELRPGEAISARANAVLGGAKLGLLLTYDAYPEECR